MLLGSRIMLQRVTEEELRETIRDEHGVSFWDSAEAAGYEPARWRESIHALDNLTGWVEVHIEQGRVLQDTRDAPRDRRGDRRLHPRRPALHRPGRSRRRDADGLPRSTRCARRRDDRRARAARPRDRAAASSARPASSRCSPSLINVIPGGVRVSLDLRSVSELHGELCDRIVAFARERGEARGVGVEFVKRQDLPVQPMDAGVVGALAASAEESGETFRQMPSGAAHDTQCVASRVPSAMVFVPCLDGLSHTPLEQADTGRRGARRGGRLQRDQGAWRAERRSRRSAASASGRPPSRSPRRPSCARRRPRSSSSASARSGSPRASAPASRSRRPRSSSRRPSASRSARASRTSGRATPWRRRPRRAR